MPPKKVDEDEDAGDQDPALVRSAKVYAPKCLVLVSRLDTFETFKVCLKVFNVLGQHEIFSSLAFPQLDSYPRIWHVHVIVNSNRNFTVFKVHSCNSLYLKNNLNPESLDSDVCIACHLPIALPGPDVHCIHREHASRAGGPGW